jgi:hypothetical protein
MSRIVTPFGIAQYPHLNRADRKFCQSPADKGAYKTNLILGPEDAETLKEAVMAELREQEVKTKGITMPWSLEVDDQDKPTGNTVFKFKANEWLVKDGERIDRKVIIVDSTKTPMSEIVGAGSEIRMSFIVYAWKTDAGKRGIQLQPVMAQVRKLVESSSSTVDDFDEVQGGFSSADAVQVAGEGEGTDF